MIAFSAILIMQFSKELHYIGFTFENVHNHLKRVIPWQYPL